MSIESKKSSHTEYGYFELFKEFNDEFNKIQNFKGTQALNFIFYLLQKYTWCVPASIFDQDRKSRHYPDISLFDHSRVLAMIATSLYDYWTEKNCPLKFDNLKKENFLLMVEGDIGGIQKFIYNIGKTQGVENFSISKALRGRSFIVSMIPELLSRYILKEIGGYPITNILYVGGGKFQLIIGNTDKNIERLKEIEEKLNRYMYEEFLGELSLTLAWRDFSGNYLLGENNSFFELIDEIQILIDDNKKRKFGKLLTQEFSKDRDSICKSCKAVPAEEGEEICSLCKISNTVGDKLPKIKFLIFDDKFTDEAHIEILNLGEFGKVYGAENIVKNLEASEILVINSTNFDKNNGFKFIGSSIPVVEKDDLDFLSELLLKDENANDELELIKEGTILPFKVLAKLSQGDEKLGVFRADVDNLGLIFSDGLRKKYEDDTNRYTISRVATLSRMLDLFFSGYINIIAQEVSDAEKVKMKDNDGNPLNLKIKSLIYTVYSGGDDIFVIAPYNVAINFALKLREKFYEYTARNLDFGLSGGILISSPTMPIKLMAKFAERLEDRSKDASYASRDNKNKLDNQLCEKDSISIFSKTYKWKKFVGTNSLCQYKLNVNYKDKHKKFLILHPVYFEDIVRITDKILEYSESISRGFFYKLLELHKKYVDNTTSSIKAAIFPYLYYHITRNIPKKEEEVRKFVENLLLIEGYKENGKIVVQRDDIIRNLDTIVSIVLMKTRGGKYHGRQSN